MVNVALPTIGDALDTDIGGLQWVVDGYVVVLAAFLLSSGSLSDRLGATRAFGGGLIGFMVASAACGMAPSLTVLLAGRFVQGLAAAVMLPSSLALVRQVFEDPRERARAIATWAAGGGVAIAAGPVVGGLLTSGVGWRAIFFVNLPVGALGLLLLARVPHSVPRRARLDLPGQLAAVVAVGGLALGVIEGGHSGFGTPVALAGLAAAVVAAVAFVAIEQRVPAPMLPLSLFRSRVVATMTTTGFVLSLAFYGQVFVLSLFLQRVLGNSPAVAGLMFLPLTGLITVVNLLAGQLTASRGPRLPLVVGQLVFAAGLLGLVVVDPQTPTALIEVLLVPLGVGGGLAIPPLTTALMDAVEPALAGVAAGALNAARQLGGAVGVAVFGALLAAGFTAGMHRAVLIGAGSTLATTALTLRNLT